MRTEQRRRMHAPLPEQHRWLSSALRGHYRYFGLPSNWHALDGFYDEVRRGWFRALRLRSQRRLTWDRFNQWLARFPLPRAHICHTRRLSLDDSDQPREEPSAGKPHAHDRRVNVTTTRASTVATPSVRIPGGQHKKQANPNIPLALPPINAPIPRPIVPLGTRCGARLPAHAVARGCIRVPSRRPTMRARPRQGATKKGRIAR